MDISTINANIYPTLDRARIKPNSGKSGRLFILETDGFLYFAWPDGTITLISGGGGGGESLALTLAIGNTTGPNNIVISNGQAVVFQSGLFTGTLNAAPLTGNRIWSLPDASGTIALLSDISNQDLASVLAVGNTTGGNPIIISAGDSLVFADGVFTSTIDTVVLTANRNIVFPDNSGTVALLSDIPPAPASAWLLNGNTNGVLAYIGTNDAFNFPIYTSGVERAVILATGNFGINQLAPTAQLHVNGIDGGGVNYVLKLENNIGESIFYAKNNASMSMGSSLTPDDTYTLTIGSKAGAGGAIRMLDSTFSEYVHFDDLGFVQFFNQTRIGLGIPYSSLTRLNISGPGATDATYGLAVTNSLMGFYGLLVDDSNSVGIGISTGGPFIDDSALLHLVSTTKGFLLMNMSEVERDAIVLPVAGLHIYNTTTNTPDYYNGVAWVNFAFTQGPAQVYTVANVTTDRAYDADLTTLDEIADVLGTLLDDLKNNRPIG